MALKKNIENINYKIVKDRSYIRRRLLILFVTLFILFARFLRV